MYAGHTLEKNYCDMLYPSGQIPCSPEDANSIQLDSTGIFSSVQGSGRVEICVCSTDTSCFWQTVSTGSQTVPFSWKNFIVACRELGFYDVESPILQNRCVIITRMLKFKHS